ncbi:TPA: hypothetical protein ACH3X1_009609 [Trebouxia sp. C0004]
MAYKDENVSRVPVTIVTGFLGSGKTTLINHVLTANHGKKVAVIENEFGEVGIDDALVKLSSQEEIIEMNNGCICCTVRGDLVKILHKLLKRRNKFDYIIIETTGLADPAPVAQTFFVDDILQEQLSLDAIVTVVDAKHVQQHLDEIKPEGVENESVEQLAFADVVVINKTDLVTTSEKNTLKLRIKRINGAAKIVETTKGQVDLDDVLNIKAFSLQKVLEMEPDFMKEEGQEHLHDESVISVGIELEGNLDMHYVNMWLSKLLTEQGVDLFRSKGILAIEGSDDKYFFQGVHMLLSFGCSAEGMGQPWDPDEKRVNKLVFIGRNLDRAELNKNFRACLASAAA